MTKEEFLAKYVWCFISVDVIGLDKQAEGVRTICNEMGYTILGTTQNQQFQKVDIVIKRRNTNNEPQTSRFEYKEFKSDFESVFAQIKEEEIGVAFAILKEFRISNFYRMEKRNASLNSEYKGSGWIMSNVTPTAAYFWTPEETYGLLVTKDYGTYKIHYKA